MSVPSSFAADDPVPDGNCWFRVLINKKYVTDDGTLAYHALQGPGAFSEPDDVNKTWTQELSGRIVSIAGTEADITAEATKRVANIRQRQKKPSKHLVFAGVASGHTHELRTMLQK